MAILVINIGLKNARCIAFSEQGEMLEQVTRPVRTFVSNERVEQDPNEWISLMDEVVGRVVTQLGATKHKIRALTVTTSASCLVATDIRGRALRPSILVSDTRAVPQVDWLREQAQFTRLQAEGMKASADLMLPKILWIKEFEPEVFKSARYYLNVGDFLVAHLSGVYVTDPNNALKFYYSMRSSQYPAELYNQVGVRLEQLPKVEALGSSIGPIKPEVAARLKLPTDCQVILSTYDALAAVSGNGAFGVGEAVDISGTVTSFRVVTNSQVFDPKGRVYLSPHADQKHWLIGGSNNLGGGLIEWLRALSYQDVENPYDVMEREAAQTAPCPGGLLFLPHLLGERAPLWNPNCRGVFFGVNRAHGRRDFSRAVFEGAAFSVKHIASVIEDLGVVINSATVAGGLSQIPLANQIKADMLGVPVKQFENFETTAIGAALIALVGMGEYTSTQQAFENFCKLKRIYEPNPQHHEVYSDYFDLYLKVYESLESCYVARSQVLAKFDKYGFRELELKENL